MIDEEKLLQFLLKARTQTYAGGKDKVSPAFKDSSQLEYQEDSWLYRDVYYTGNKIFMGIEVVYYKDNAVWAMSYYGNYKQMTEEEIDSVLRRALLDNWKRTRLWKKVQWATGNYEYLCEPDFDGSIKELAGVEKILREGTQIYTLFYAGALIDKE